MSTALALLACMLSCVPAALFLQNLALYRPLPPAGLCHRRCSVLIPARNEERNIAAALEAVLRCDAIDFEVIVLDDGSTDRTAEIVRAYAVRDSRVRLHFSAPLPPGWCGKNHACHQLASLAAHPLLVFLDADVRVTRPDALARLAEFMETGKVAFASGVPHEETRTLLEQLIIPLIHFVLLGFLPLARMRAGTDPRFAAACGQLIAVRRDAYLQAGGHAAIAATLHDGLNLCRRFREHGFATDLFDATDTFRCRMYHSAAEVWQGFAKNACEALADPRLIVPSTLLLLGGQVLPLCLLLATPSTTTRLAAAFATIAAFLPRLIAVVRFRQPLPGALLHPVGITIFVAIQWYAFLRSLRGRPSTWKGRAYAPA